MAEISTDKIPGLIVYGVQQVSYTVDGKSGVDYGSALAAASLQSAGALEKEGEAFSAMVRLRARKLEELGEALSIISKAIASLSKRGSYTHSDPDLKKADEILRKYDIGSLTFDDDTWQASRESVMTNKNELQYRIDLENNTLQQDMVSLQSLVKKRDTSFSAAKRLLDKINTTSDTVIANVGE